MLFKGTNGNDVLEGTDKNDTIQGNGGNDIIISNDGDDLVSGGAGSDFLFGFGDDPGEAALAVGGSDTLTGGKGQDTYSVSLKNSGGSVIEEESKSNDIVFIVSENTDINALVSISNSGVGADEGLEFLSDPSTWGDAAIKLSRPKKGSVGLKKSGTSLIIDISRDGVAKANDDLTISNYFDDQGDLGSGAPALINNIVDQQEIVDFFA